MDPVNVPFILLSLDSRGFEHEPSYMEQIPGADHRATSGDEDSMNSLEMDRDNGDNADADSDRRVLLLPPSTHNPEGTHIFYTVFLIVNAALGAGLLHFPRAFADSGGVSVAITVQVKTKKPEDVFE